MKKFLLALFLILSFTFGASAAQFEYKIVPLGSLGGLQKEKTAATKSQQIEEILNKYGADGWEVSEIFAVRTTFDPNVFFVLMKREK